MKIKGKEVRLPKRFKARWVKALRSGDYLQTTGELYNAYENDEKGGMCCIGVAGAICKVPLNDMEGYGLFNKDEFYEIEDMIKSYKIPRLLTGSHSQEDKDYNPIVQKLAKYNDSGNWSFKRIASYIERYL